MIYLISREGQMCNQLVALAAVCTLGVEHGCGVRCPVTDTKLKEWFCFAEKVGGIKIETYSSPIWMCVRAMYKVLNKILHIHVKTKYDSSKTNQYFFDIVSFFEPEMFARHIEEIREFLDFRIEVKERCLPIIEKYKNENKILVGVHIRRGDYKEFYGGKWYYSDEEYVRWMKTLAAAENVKFILCSNEKIALEKYREHGLDVCAPEMSAVEELCLLSLCDYIMSPPSTFSLWAAMIGGKKRWILDEPTFEISWGEEKLTEERIFAGEKVR